MMLTASSCALVLDWNGTAVDDLERAVRATNDVLHTMGGRPLEVDDFRTRFTLPLSRFFSALSIPSDSIAAATDLWNDRVRQYPARLSPGMLDLASECRLRHVDVVIVSAAQGEVVAEDADALGITPLLTKVIAPSADKRRELHELRHSYRQIAYVGDTDSDVRAAHAAGVTAIGYTGGYHRRERLAASGADALVDHLGRVLTRWRLLHPDAVTAAGGRSSAPGDA